MTSLRACYSSARREALDYGLLYPLAEQLLDRCKVFRFIGADERESVAFAPRARRAPDTVHIVLGNVRQLEVHDLRQIVNVESPRGNIRRHENADLSAFEVGKSTRAGALGLVAVNRVGTDPIALQMSCQPIRSPLGAREDERLLPVLRTDEKAQKLRLLLAIDWVNDLRHAVHRGAFRLDLDAPRLVQKTVGKLANFARQSRREQKVLARRRQRRENPADVGKKPHVEHPVRFIENENLDAGEVHRPLLEVIE